MDAAMVSKSGKRYREEPVLKDAAEIVGSWIEKRANLSTSSPESSKKRSRMVTNDVFGLGFRQSSVAAASEPTLSNAAHNAIYSSCSSKSLITKGKKGVEDASKRCIAAAASRRSSKSAIKASKQAVEKRLERYVSRPNAFLRDRIARALSQRLYLIGKQSVGDTVCEFFILGASGNVYTVTLEQRPSCSCPDFPRHKNCKHLFFVMLRVLKLSDHDPRIWQRALLSSEISDLLNVTASHDDVLASDSVRERFHEIMGGREESNTIHQRAVSGDCPVCYEAMDRVNGNKQELVVFCRVCGNNVHRDCFERWSSCKRSSVGKVTCIYCRALWGDGFSGAEIADEGYINLARY